jgi:hypothetical protein
MTGRAGRSSLLRIDVQHLAGDRPGSTVRRANALDLPAPDRDAQEDRHAPDDKDQDGRSTAFVSVHDLAGSCQDGDSTLADSRPVAGGGSRKPSPRRQPTPARESGVGTTGDRTCVMSFSQRSMVFRRTQGLATPWPRRSTWGARTPLGQTLHPLYRLIRAPSASAGCLWRGPLTSNPLAYARGSDQEPDMDDGVLAPGRLESLEDPISVIAPGANWFRPGKLTERWRAEVVRRPRKTPGENSYMPTHSCAWRPK